jgi:non-specific serine/threonine protein kinase
LEASAALAEKLLASCPRLQILATSREALGIGGEQTYRVPSLAQDDAMQLFVERAAQQRPEFVQTEQNAATLAAICTRLDGIPLAIELAAARLRALSLDELQSKLSQSFAVLTGGSRTVLPRHQTLRGLIDWSYDLLTESEKALLGRLSVFAGGWSLEAAERVCSCEEIPDSAVLDVLTSLVDKSLVVVTNLLGSTRYRLLETVRQYAHERLKERGTEPVQAAHLEYFCAFCQASFPKQYQADAATEFNQLEQEHDNIRVALQFGTTTPNEILQCEALEIAGLLRRFWFMRSHLREATQWYEVILALPVAQEPSEAQGRCLLGIAGLAKVRGDYSEAKALLEKCVVDQKSISHHVNVSIALTGLGMLSGEVWGNSDEALAYYQESLIFAEKGNNLNAIAHATINIGIILKSRELLEKGVALARTQGNKDLIAAALGALGELVYRQGEFLKARALGKENLMLCQELGTNHALVIALNYMGLFAQGTGDLSVARRYREESLLLAQKLSIHEMCVVVLGDIAELDGLEGNDERSAKLWGTVTALRTKHNATVFDKDEHLNKLRTTLGDAAFERAFEEGTHLTLPEAIALATNPG